MKKAKSRKNMTVFGVGPKLVLGTVLFTLLVIGLCAKLPGNFHMSFLLSPIRVTLGILLIVAGGILYVLSAKTILKGFPAGKLLTTGVYGLCRHPLYASWGLFILPGGAFLVDNWLTFTIPVFMCVLIKLLVGKEEKWLEGKFGRRYLNYKNQVPALLPIGMFKQK